MNDRAIYNRGERGQGDAHHGGERERKKEQRESIWWGDMTSLHIVLLIVYL